MHFFYKKCVEKTRRGNGLANMSFLLVVSGPHKLGFSLVLSMLSYAASFIDFCTLTKICFFRLSCFAPEEWLQYVLSYMLTHSCYSLPYTGILSLSKQCRGDLSCCSTRHVIPAAVSLSTVLCHLSCVIRLALCHVYVIPVQECCECAFSFIILHLVG